MGGRGRMSKTNSAQTNFYEYENRKEVQDIIAKAGTYRSDLEITSDDDVLLRQCMCCGYYTIPYDSKYHQCEICGWIDDSFQNTHPDSTQGRNPCSLNEAKLKNTI